MKRTVTSALTILGIAAALSAAFQTVPVPAEPLSDVRETGAAPRIVFEETEHDFGQISRQETVKHTFKFSNEGSAVLVIEKIKTTCGCTGTLLSKRELLPGEDGSVEVTYKSGYSSGRKNKKIFVHSNDPERRILGLHISAQVVVPVEARPRSVYWVIEQATASMRTVELLYQAGLSVNITGLELSSPAFTAAVRPENGSETPGYSIDIEYDGGLPIGNFNESLTILSDHPDYPRLKVPIRGRVLGSVRVVPDKVSLGVIKDDSLPTRVVQVYALAKADFEVIGVESTSPLISAKFSRKSASNRYEVKVTLAEKPPVGAFSAKLFIKTNDPVQDSIEVSVFGIVR